MLQAPRLRLETGEPRYDVVTVELSGPQPVVVELGFPADYFAVLDSTADLDRVYVAFNEPRVYVPLSKATRARLGAPVLTRLLFRWEPSEEGKRVTIYYAGAPALTAGENLVTLAADYVGLAKEDTLQNLVAIANDIDSKVATEVTLSNVLTTLQDIDGKIATEATLSNVLATLQDVDSKVATESTLSLVAQRLTAELLAETAFSYDNSAGTSAVEAAVFSTAPTAPDYGVATIQFYVDSSVTVKVGITRGGAERKAFLNGGSAVNANAWYEFSMSLAAKDTIQIYVDVPAGATVNGYFAILFRRR